MFTPAMAIIVQENTTVSARFGLCDVVECGISSRGVSTYDVYICVFLQGHPTSFSNWCPSWSMVYWNSNPSGYSFQPGSTKWQQFKQQIALIRDLSVSPLTGIKRNPLILTFKPMCASPWGGSDFMLTLGVDVPGTDPPQALIKVQLIPPPPIAQSSIPAPSIVPTLPSSQADLVTYPNLSDPQQHLQIETGYAD
ncbi:hypothetical protein ILYODFUR_038322 [Ilyodon furcidens]|uniref:Uncharacterized protein n=1 Tax=Ilyodon furcidens TaxID=33524 RepID=A0ABV0VB68_9TELE